MRSHCLADRSAAVRHGHNTHRHTKHTHHTHKDSQTHHTHKHTHTIHHTHTPHTHTTHTNTHIPYTIHTHHTHTHTHVKHNKNSSVQSSAVRKLRPIFLLVKLKCSLNPPLITLSTEWYFLTSINHGAPIYAVFSSLLSLRPTCTQLSLRSTRTQLSLRHTRTQL